MKSGMLGLALAIGLPAPAFANETEQALRSIHQLNQVVIKAASLAQRRAGTGEVRSYGRRLEMDHRFADYEVLELAAELDLVITKPVEAQDDSEEAKRRAQLAEQLAELEQKQGAEFDLAFVRLMRSSHLHGIDVLTSAQRHASPGLVRFLERMIPILEQHVELAVHLSGTYDPRAER